MAKATARNPFGLTYRQCELMDLLVRHGSVKAIAHQEQQNHKTIRNTLRTAFDKMGCATDVLAAVKWDRKRRELTETHIQRTPNSVFSIGTH